MPQKYPLWHVSIRVPWHDTSWDGRTFDFPHLNGSCLKLKRIAEDKNKAAERAIVGQSLNDVPQETWPCCVNERVAFMAPFDYTKIKNHPYNRGPDVQPEREPDRGIVVWTWLDCPMNDAVC